MDCDAGDIDDARDALLDNGQSKHSMQTLAGGGQVRTFDSSESWNMVRGMVKMVTEVGRCKVGKVG